MRIGWYGEERRMKDVHDYKVELWEEETRDR